MNDGANRLQVPAHPDNSDTARRVSQAITLDRLDGDVWAWRKRVTGKCPGCPLDASIALRVNDALIPAKRDNDSFEANVALEPGANHISGVVTYPNGETVESESVLYNVRLTPRPTARIAIRVIGKFIVFDATPSAPSAFDGASIVSWTWSFREDNPAALDVIEDLGALVTVRAPDANDWNADGEYFVSLTVTDAKGRADSAAGYFVFELGAARVPDPMTHQNAWIERATVYGAIPFTFGEPGFKAVEDRLDDLRDLGIAAIWLSPINKTLPGEFGYGVTDYFDIRPDWGTKEDFRALVQAAHARGIRVLMDFVPNHSSIRHPYFDDMVQHGKSSLNYDFYDRDEKGETTFYFHYVHLHNLNFDNPEVWNFMIEAFAYWVREFDVDGFRVDVAWGIRQRRPDFWPACNRELKRIKPDALLIAEASARDLFYVENGFDSAYDWTEKLGQWAWTELLTSGKPMAEGMKAALPNENERYRFHPGSLIFRFLNNNDTGPRFITTYGVDSYRVASAMLLTLPGLPCVYSGDEVGAEYLPYDGREVIDWTDRHGLRNHFKHLIALRSTHPSLHSRFCWAADVEPKESLLGYLRHLAFCESPILVLLNFSGDAVEAKVRISTWYGHLTKQGIVTDLYTDERVDVSAEDGLTVPMPAWGIRILILNVGVLL